MREVEAFLLDIDKELLNHLEKLATTDTRKKHNISNKITSFLTNLNSQKDLVIVLTKKTNTVHLMKKGFYSNMVTMHLSKEAIQTDLENINRSPSSADLATDGYIQWLDPWVLQERILCTQYFLYLLKGMLISHNGTRTPDQSIFFCR